MDTEVLTPSPSDLARTIEREWESWVLRSRKTPTPHATVWASSWRTCERRMVLELTVPDQQPPFDARVLARFRRGDDRERDLLADLTRIGRDATDPFEVIGQQSRFELKGRTGAVVISGKVDARLRVGRSSTSAPIEVKSWSPFLVDRLERFEDVFDNQWTRSGGYQLLSYLFGANEPFGFLLLDRSGIPLLLPVELDATNLERMEEFLATAERVVAHREAGTLPAFYDDPAECHRCPFFGGACNPPTISKVAEVFTDPELEAHLERWHELRGPGKEWQSLDMDLKRHLRGVESAIVGHFAITGRWGKTSRLDLPDPLKRQYTITDPRGRFSLEIERL